MVANKIKLNGNVILDLSEDDVSESDVSFGKRFHKADGTTALGSFLVSGDLPIFENGTYDVYNKSTVTVKVPQPKAEIKNKVLYITLEA